MDPEPIYHLSDSIALALKREKLQSSVVSGQDGNEYHKHWSSVKRGTEESNLHNLPSAM